MLRTAQSVRMLQMLAAVLGVAIVLWTTNFGAVLTAQAAAVTNASDTLSTSAPNTGANHTLVFRSPNGLVAGQTIEITFDASFGIPTIGLEDVDLATSTAATGPWTEETLAGAQGAADWGYSTTSNTLVFQAPSGYGAASSTYFQIQVGTNATGGDTQITNPTSTTTSYQIQIGGTMQDSGEVRVAVLDTVTVSAAVDTVFDFTVAGVASGSTVNGSPTTTASTTQHNTLPFGELVVNQSRTLAHDLTITTNAANGYVVTVEQTQDLLSSTGADINGYIDGSYTDTPTAWTAPGAVVGTDTTYGHWGLTSDDLDLNGQGTDFTSDTWVSASSTQPRVIAAHGGVVNATSTRVGYQIQISALQEAGTDYTTQLIYIATPVF